MDLKEIYTPELNHKIDELLETRITDYVNDGYEVYENYELSKIVTDMFDCCIVLFKGQVKNIYSNECRKSMNLYVVDNNEIEEYSTNELFDLCSCNKYLFCSGFSK